MAEIKIIRAVYKEYADKDSALLFCNWYKKTDIAIAEADVNAKIDSPDVTEKGEFIGWEERDLDTGD